MERTRTWWKAEPFLFLFFVLITALPVLANQYFPTVDGPAHLHNANLLKHYWFFHDDFLLNFFELNKHLNSNFVDHVWFAVFGLFLPTYLVEKSILLFYLLTIPFAFRYLVRTINPSANVAAIASYLIFPFVYSFTFRIGFFNFCMGIPLLFWTLGYWIRYRSALNGKKITWLCVMATLVYVSHLFNFMLLGIFLFSYELQHLIHSGTIKGIIGKLKVPVIVFIPGVLLSALFFISNSSFEHSPPTYLSKSKLTETLIDLSPCITLNYDREINFARVIGIALLLLIALVAAGYIRSRKNAEASFQPKWMHPLMAVLLLFYVFPDWIASGGFISIRWALFFFLSLIILIASKELPLKFLMPVVALLLINHLFFISYHNEQTAILSDDAKTLVDGEQYMENGKVLLPLNYSNNWIHINHADYLATTKNIVCLDNYEPTKPHFPLIWKKGEQVYELMDKYGNRNPPCINIVNYETTTHHRIDYLSRFDFDGNVSDSCTALVEQEIKNRFELIYQSENKKLQLYKRKPGT